MRKEELAKQLKGVQAAYDSKYDVVESMTQRGMEALKSKIKGVQYEATAQSFKTEQKHQPRFEGTQLAEKQIDVYKSKIKTDTPKTPAAEPTKTPFYDDRDRLKGVALSLSLGRNGNSGKVSPPASDNGGNASNITPDYYALTTSMTLEEYQDYVNKKFMGEEKSPGCGVCASDPCECEPVEEEEEEGPTVLDYLKEELLELDDSAWQSIDMVMRRVSEEVGCTPKELHKAFKAEEGVIPDVWLEENREVEVCGYMPLEEASIHKQGMCYDVTCMWRGSTKRLKFFWPQMKAPSKQEMQDACCHFYPGCRVLAFYPTLDDRSNVLVMVPPMTENFHFVQEDMWVEMDEEMQDKFEYICEEEGEPVTAPVLLEDGSIEVIVEDHDTGEENTIIFEKNKSGDSSLHDWFSKSKSSDGKPGWVQLGGKFAGKPCARQPGQTSTPKCGSSKMKRNLSKDEEEKAFRRKNREDGNQPNKSGAAKPTNVRTEELKCWKGYKRKPGSVPGAKGSCVKEEEYVTEISKELATKAYAQRRTNEFEADQLHTKSDKTHNRIVKKHGKKAGEDADKAANKQIFGEDMSGMSQKSGDKRSTESGAGMTAQGVAKYNRRTGGNLKTAVTTPPSKLKPGSKAANRRKSFCARSRGWTGERGKAARRRWNC